MLSVKATEPLNAENQEELTRQIEKCFKLATSKCTSTLFLHKILLQSATFKIICLNIFIVRIWMAYMEKYITYSSI